jgi:hypothetical protein
VSLDEVRGAAEALRRKVVGDPSIGSATIEPPIAILGPDDALDSWFVGFTKDERLLGFLQLEPDLTLHRYSAFERPPPASVWLDPDAVRAHAQAAVSSEDELGDPVLTYRESRDRLTWNVPIRNRPGTIYVAGDYVEVAMV